MTEAPPVTSAQFMALPVGPVPEPDMAFYVADTEPVMCCDADGNVWRLCLSMDGTWFRLMVYSLDAHSR